MPIPAGYTLDTPTQAASAGLPAGYTLDQPQQPQAQAQQPQVQTQAKPQQAPSVLKTLAGLYTNTPILPGAYPGQKSPGIDIAGQHISYPTYGGLIEGATNILPALLQGGEHLIDKITGAKSPSMTDAPVQAIHDTAKNLDINDPVGSFIGGVAPLISLGGVGAGAKSSEALSGLSRLWSVLKSVPKNAAIGAVAAPALTPEANLNPNDPNDYANRKWSEAGTGALLGAALPVAGEYAPDVLKGVTSPLQTTRKAFGVDYPINDTGGVAADVLKNYGISISDFKDAAQTHPELAPDIHQLTISAAKEHGIPVTRGNILNDPRVRQLEQDFAGRRGSIGNDIRMQQGTALNNAIGNIENKAGTAYQEAITPTLPPDVQIPNSSQVVQNKIQQSEKAALATDRANYTSLNADIDAANQASIANGGPDLNKVNPINAYTKITEAINKNNASLSYDPQLNTILTDLQTRLQNPASDLTFQGVKDSVSKLESQIEGFKSVTNPNRYSANTLQDIAHSLDNAADNTASTLLGSTDKVQAVSDFHKTNIVPFRDTDTGLPQIINGPYSDKATKAFLSAASPEQFTTLASNLDATGKIALKQKILEAAHDAATANGTLNPQAWADYLSKRAPQLQALYADDAQGLNKLQSLIHLTQTMPEAGTLGKVPGLLEMGRNRLVAKSLAGLAGMPGGPMGVAATEAAEAAGEHVINKAMSQYLFKPLSIPTIKSNAELMKLPKGSAYYDGNGTPAIKP